MSLRLYEDALPNQIEYFVGNSRNKLEFLREAEEVTREKFVIDHLFKNVLNSILKVVDKFEKPLDVSKGDIKRVVGGKELLETINKLSKEVGNGDKDVNLNIRLENWGINEYIGLARKAYLYASNLSKVFTAGYRNNNLLVMSYYKGVTSNIFALVGECVAYTINKEPIDYKSLRVKTLRDFVIAYEDGSVHKFLETSQQLLESFDEYNETNVILSESFDIVQTSMKFIRKFVNNIDKNGQIGSMVYKAVEFIKQVLSLKQMFWPMIVNMLPKMNEYINLFKGFLGSGDVLANMGGTQKIAKQILDNSVRADDRANYLISVDNDTMYNQIQKNWDADQKVSIPEEDDFKF